MVETRPLIIASAGTVCDLLSTSPKGYKKSIETQQVWHVAEGGSLLPYALAHSLDTIHDHGTWYVANIVAASPGSVHNAAVKHTETIHNSGSERTIPADRSPSSRAESALSGRHTSRDNIIGKLTEIIAKKKHAQATNSYTAYLFAEGGEKIRKKLAEEVIELVLAQGATHIQSEAADVLYHLLVFLEQESISWTSVLDVLRKRNT